MASTLLEAAQNPGSNYTTQEMAVVQLLDQISPVLRRIPMSPVDGGSYTFHREEALPSAGWRSVNEGWSESTGRITKLQESLMILGGEFSVDRAILKMEPSRALSEWTKQAKLKVKAVATEFDRAFFEGDDLTSPNQLVGLRRRLGGNQVQLMASGGGTLTLAALDELLDRVPFPNKVMYLNRTLRRKITALCDAATGSRRVEVTQDGFGRQKEMYGGCELAIVERSGDGSTFLDFDEDPGDATADCASIYVVSYGDELVKGLYAASAGKTIEVEDLGLIQASPVRKGRIEAYFGLAMEHPRAAARLRAITNS